MKRIAFLSCLVFAVLWTACSGEIVNNNNGDPSVTLTLDKQTAKAGDTIKLSIEVKNFQLDKNKMDSSNQSGTGHYHVYLDDKKDTDYFAADAAATLDFKVPSDITEGKHTLRVELRNNDHSPLDPVVEAKAEFTVAGETTGGDPKVTATLDQNKTKAGGVLKITVKTENFSLVDPKPGMTPKANEGHYHVYLDDNVGSNYLYAGSKDSTEITIPVSAAPGAHKLRVSLRNNDHTPLDPVAEATLDIEVEAPQGPAVSATVTPTSPTQGQELEVKVSVVNFKLDKNKIGKTNEAGVGHYHIYLDDKTGNDYIHVAADATTKFKLPGDISKGEHSLRISLRNNDHSALSPVAEAKVKINVVENTSPKVTATIDKTDVETDSDVTVDIKTQNFILDPASIGKANVSGSGHYHIYLDDKTGNDYLYAGANGKATFRIPADATEGAHKLRVSLRNNDHSELNPKAEAIIDIKVTKGNPSVTGTANPKVVFSGGEIKLDLKVRNFTLDASQIGKAPKAGVGHIHIYLDQETGTNYLYAGADANPTVTIPVNTKPGAHILRVSLRNNDHSALNPVAEVKLDFNITEDSKPAVTAKADKTTVEAGKTFKLTVSTTNFILDVAQIGKANKLGTGHYHVYMDNNTGLNYLYAGADLNPTITIPNATTKGKHTIRVSLRNNDHTPFTPTTEATFDLTINESTSPVVSATIANNLVIAGDKVKLAVTTKNFTLNPNGIGKANVAGEGHIHVYLDNNVGSNYLYAGADANPEFTIPAATTLGVHQLHVVLHNNDHSEYSPKTEAIVNITVSDGSPKVFAQGTKGSVKPGEQMGVSVTVQNFKLDPNGIGKANVKGEGHIHIYLDNETGSNYLYAGADANPTFNIPASTKAGAHTLRVALHNNDHSAVSPAVEATVSFTVSSGSAPSVTATPDKTTIAAGDKITLTVTAQNFSIDASQIGKANSPGVGHYHVYLDNETGNNYLYAGADAKAVITIPGTTAAGAHTLRVSLRNNDHSAVSPAVEATVNFTVSSGTAPKCSASYANCTNYTDLTASASIREVKFGSAGSGNSYTPKCIKIKVGQTVKFDGNFSGHPLKTQCQEASDMTDTSTGTTKNFTFTKPGYYNYYCQFHSNGTTGSGMAGNIWVVP
ncbi:MAG: hypothetical protein CL920_29465 [Deltaproteobacteria bacterium]|nr:hypothetical protein [Deltaproteobacteria bacterium]MBU52841.1 hypothetical protein [Deltaproteobacteria bacterium]